MEAAGECEDAALAPQIEQKRQQNQREQQHCAALAHSRTQRLHQPDPSAIPHPGRPRILRPSTPAPAAMHTSPRTTRGLQHRSDKITAKNENGRCRSMTSAREFGTARSGCNASTSHSRARKRTRRPAAEQAAPRSDARGTRRSCPSPDRGAARSHGRARRPQVQDSAGRQQPGRQELAAHPVYVRRVRAAAEHDWRRLCQQGDPSRWASGQDDHLGHVRRASALLGAVPRGASGARATHASLAALLLLLFFYGSSGRLTDVCPLLSCSLWLALRPVHPVQGKSGFALSPPPIMYVQLHPVVLPLDHSATRGILVLQRAASHRPLRSNVMLCARCEWHRSAYLRRRRRRRRRWLRKQSASSFCDSHFLHSLSWLRLLRTATALRPRIYVIYAAEPHLCGDAPGPDAARCRPRPNAKISICANSAATFC
jgi:hypothetical protein